MDIQKARDWADLLLKSLSIVAIIAGGIWAYYGFWVTETNVENVQITVSTEQQPYSKDSRLLLIHVKPHNIGKVLVSTGKAGFIVTVRSIPNNLKHGVVDLEAMPEIYKTDLLKRFPDGYEIEPGGEYDEDIAMIVPRHSMYSIRATLDMGNNNEVDHTTIARIE